MTTKKRVLILDDDEEDIDILTHHLESCSAFEAEIVTASTPDAAMKALRDTPFDVVFVDYRLDGSQKGTGILEQLRDLPAQPRLILCSGNEESFLDRDAMQHMRSGKMRFLSKRSVSQKELTELVLGD